jgi:hypothetical protein
MTIRILPGFAALASLTLFSCYPMPENERHPQGPASHQTVTSPEQQKMEQQRERLKRQAQLENQAPEQNTTGNGTVTEPSNSTPKPPTETKRDYPFANSVPGKEGFVFSPYNNKVIDVRDMPTGTLVQDPTYPAAEKKFFRVP